MKKILKGTVVWLSVLFAAGLLPAAPVANSVFPTIDPDTLALTWDNQAGNAYNVLISSDPTYAVVVASGLSPIDQNTTTFLSLQPNTSYTIKVKLETDDDVNYIGMSTVTKAAVPSNLTSPLQTVSSIKLEWQMANSTWTPVEISSSTDDFGTQIAVPTPFTPFENPTVTYSNLREKTTYYFRMRARNSGNLDSGFSTVLATRTASINPEGISNLTRDDTFMTYDGGMRFSWTPPGGDENASGVNVVSYIVRVATFVISTAEFDLPRVSTYPQNWTPNPKGGSSEFRTLTGLNPGTTYYVAVKGVDSVGNVGFWSTGTTVSPENASGSDFAKDLPPGQPSGFKFDHIFSSAVVLSWTAPPVLSSNTNDLSAYRVYWATWSFALPSDPFVFQTTGTLHPVSAVSVTGLANETAYYFRVSAVDKGDQGSGLFSHALEGPLSASTMTVTVDVLAPAAVSDLTALTGENEGEITLQWTSPGDDGTQKNLLSGSRFRIKYSSNGLINGSQFDAPPSNLFVYPPRTISTQTAPGAQQSILLTGLVPNVTYWFSLKTTDEAGNDSVWFSSKDVVTMNVLASTTSRKDTAAPNTVTGLSLTAGYHTIALSWITPGDNDRFGMLNGTFTIKYGVNPINNLADFYAAASTITISTSVAPGISVGTAAFNLSNNTTYYFAVLAGDDWGNTSIFSAAESSSTYPRNQSPGAFSITSPADGTLFTALPINIVWSASADADSGVGDTVTYELIYSTHSDFSAPTATEAAGGATNKNIAGTPVEDAVTFVRIRASDSDGAATYTPSISFTKNLLNTVPSTFSLLLPENSSTTRTAAPTLFWQASTDPDPGDGITYTLKYSQNDTADGGTTVTSITTTHYTLPALTENSTYYWKVFAVSTNPFTGSDTVQGEATFYFIVNAANEAPNAFALLSPTANLRVVSTLPTFVWQTATVNDPWSSVNYTLTVENTVDNVVYSTTLPNLTVTTYTLTEALADNTPYTWKVTAKNTANGLTTTASPSAGRVIKLDLVKQLPPAVVLSTPANQVIVTSTGPFLYWNSVSDPDNPQDYSGMDRVRYIVKIGERSDYSDALGQQIFFSESNGFMTRRQFALKDQTTYFWQVAAAGAQPVGTDNDYVNVDTGGVAGCTSIVGGGTDECFSVSAQFTFTVSLVNTNPSAVDLSLPADAGTLSTDLPYFDWSDSIETDPAQYADYTLQISTDPGFSLLIFTSTGIASSSFTMTTPLLQNRNFYWRVKTQDRFIVLHSSSDLPGNGVFSNQNFSFRIPYLTSPKEPTGVKGSLSADKNSFTISWSAVTQNINGNAISDLGGYRIYRALTTSGLGNGTTPYVSVGSTTLVYTDTSSITGNRYFYTIRAFNNSFQNDDSSGSISLNSMVVNSGEDGSLLVVPGEPELEGKIEISIPSSVKSVLEKGNNAYGEDLKIQLEKTTAQGLKSALLGINIKIRTAESDKEVGNFTFSQPIMVSFPLAGIGAPQFASPAAAGASGSELAVFWFNGVRWVNLGGAESGGSVSANTRLVGEFAVKTVTKADSFDVMAITPKKVFTPNGDGCNDVISFQYQNPRGNSDVKGKIFDVQGAYIAELKAASELSIVTLDASCPQPNLADDVLVWDGKNSDGRSAKKGVYIYQIEGDGKTLSGTIVVAR